MSKQINKIVDNYPVLLNRDEKDNLVKTLSSIILEVAPGGSGGGKTYYGADGVYVDNDNNRITLESTAKNAIDNIPHTVGELTDSANYQTVAGMSNYLTTATYQTDSATFLTQTSASQNLAPISVTADIETLKAASGDFNNYYTKEETDVLTEAAKSNAKSYAYSLSQLKQDKLTFEYDSNDAISSINHSALAGQGGTTYTEGNGISITNDTISISADYIQAITSVSAIKGTVLTGDANIRTTSAEDGNNIKWTLELTAQPTVTDTTLSGADGIVAVKDSSVTSQWNVTIAQAYRQEIEAVSGKLTKASADTLYAPNSVTGDVDTLKSSSGNWDKVSDKLDTTAFSNVSGTFLTAHQSLDDYATKSDINGMATQTWVGEQGFYTKASGDNDYAPKSVTSTINTLTGASAGWNEVTAKLDASVASTTYQTKEDMNDYLTKSEASTTYQPTGNYLVADDITGKLDKSVYANASGNWENTYNVVNQYSAAGTWLTAHQSLTNYYQKTETSSKDELSDEFAKYVTSSTVTTQGTDYVMTTTGWKVLSLPGGGMTQVIHDDTLTGQGNADNNKLGVAWSALSGNTINSAKSAGSATSALSAEDALSSRYAKQLKDASKVIEISAITALQNWASSNSSTWDEVSSKLDTTAFSTVSGTYLTKSSADNDYAPLSITADVNTLTAASAGWNNKVDKPTSLVNKYLVLRTDGSGNVSGWYDLQDQSYSKSEAQDTFIHRDMLDNGTGGTLTGTGLTGGSILRVNTDVIQTKLTDAQLSAISSVSGKVDIPTATSADNKYLVYSTKTSDSGWCELTAGGDYLPLSGGTVSGQLVVSGGSNFDTENLKFIRTGQNGYGRIGLASDGALALKVDNGSGDTLQINMSTEGSTGYGNINVNNHGNQSKVVNVPTASYNSMSSFDNTNGPNYMLRKTASGFDIGAAVINVTQLPAQTEANTYYFIYDT